MVYTLLAEGFEEIEALTVVDVLRRAEISVKTVSASGDEMVRGGHGIAVKTDISIDEVEISDLLFLPGGMPGVTNLENEPKVKDIINRYIHEGKMVAAICAAPSILGKMGILNGKKATCYPGFENFLEGADVLTEAVVKDGNVITSRGAGTAADLAFELVKLFKGEALADKLRTGMIYE